LIDDEAVTPDQRDVLAGVVKNHGHGARAHAEDVLLELHTIRQFNAGHRDIDVRAVIDQPLTMNDQRECGRSRRRSRGDVIRRPAPEDGWLPSGVAVVRWRRIAAVASPAALTSVRNIAENSTDHLYAELMLCITAY
jgi:hypothetical protein